MNITRESKSAHNDILKIELTKEDYAAGYEKKLKKYSKEMNVNGFRKGAVPVGMIKKMYGESILVEEINHLADTALQDFVKENDIKLLGRPMLADGQELLDIKPNEDKTYQINFEIGYEPAYTFALTDTTFKKFEIDVTSEMVNKEIENVKAHFAKLEDSAEPVALGDTFYFNFDNTKAIKGESFSSTDELTDAGRAAFVGKKMGDKVEGIATELFDATKFDVNRYILNITEATDETNAQVLESVSFELTNVKKKMTPETLTSEQISGVCRDESKTTMEDLKASLEADIKTQYEGLSHNFLRNDVYEHVVENTKIDLPVEFLKKWIVSEKENNLTTEKVEKEFGPIEKSIKWDLMTSRFATENDIKVEVEEIKNEFKTRYMQYFMQSGYNPPADQLEKFAEDAMKDQKNVRKTFESILDGKILDGMIAQVKTESIKYTEEQFTAESKARNEKRAALDAKAEEEHVHDEHCGHEH
jgi:trigger factor